MRCWYRGTELTVLSLHWRKLHSEASCLKAKSQALLDTESAGNLMDFPASGTVRNKYVDLKEAHLLAFYDKSWSIMTIFSRFAFLR